MEIGNKYVVMNDSGNPGLGMVDDTVYTVSQIHSHGWATLKFWGGKRWSYIAMQMPFPNEFVDVTDKNTVLE